MHLLIIISSLSLVGGTIGTFLVHHFHKKVKVMHEEVSSMLVTIRHANEIRLAGPSDPSAKGGNIGRQRT